MASKLQRCKKCGRLRGQMKGSFRLCLCDITDSKGNIDLRLSKNSKWHVKSGRKKENLTNPSLDGVSRIDESRAVANVGTIDKYPSIANNNLGCGKEFMMNTSSGFICGVANAWGTERLCPQCDIKLRKKWAEEDRNNVKLQNQLKGGNTK